MKSETFQSRAFAALGNEARLGIFRLLVRAGQDGLCVGDIGAHFGFKPSTLAHHLGTLVHAGLVIQEKKGREVYSRVDYEAMNGLLDFLTEECCSGVD